jgi:hypothetical protein
MFKNSMITPTLRFKQQKNIARSHYSPHRYSLVKKVGQLKIDAAKLPVNEILKK